MGWVSYGGWRRGEVRVTAYGLTGRNHGVAVSSSGKDWGEADVEQEVRGEVVSDIQMEMSRRQLKMQIESSRQM